MKVIKKEDVGQWAYKHICSSCDSELLVEAKDLRYTFHNGDCRDPGYETYTATCAVCSGQIAVPASKIPKPIQLEAKNRTSRYSGGGYFDR